MLHLEIVWSLNSLKYFMIWLVLLQKGIPMKIQMRAMPKKHETNPKITYFTKMQSTNFSFGVDFYWLSFKYL